MYNFRRNLHVTCIIKNAYEGPGKTTITFIKKEIGSRLLVTRCDEVIGLFVDIVRSGKMQ